MKIMGNEYTKLVVMNLKTKEELAVVTDEEITTASQDLAVKLTPTYDEASKDAVSIQVEVGGLDEAIEKADHLVALLMLAKHMTNMPTANDAPDTKTIFNMEVKFSEIPGSELETHDSRIQTGTIGLTPEELIAFKEGLESAR